MTANGAHEPHCERPAHGCPPPEGEPGQHGYVVGYIAELDDDTEGNQFVEYSGDVHETWEDAHTVWKKAQNWRPGWRLYSLTDMTEKPKRRRVDIENENAELDQIRGRLLKERDAYRRALSKVLAEHQPMVVEPLGGPGLQLRCRRCHTDEHHTVAHDNHMLWPCPTLAPFVTYAAPTSPEPATDQE